MTDGTVHWHDERATRLERTAMYARRLGKVDGGTVSTMTKHGAGVCQRSDCDEPTSYKSGVVMTPGWPVFFCSVRCASAARGEFVGPVA